MMSFKGFWSAAKSQFIGFALILLFIFGMVLVQSEILYAMILGGLMMAISAFAALYIYFYHYLLKFQNYVVVELLVRDGARDKRFLRFMIHVDDIHGTTIKEQDLLSGGEAGQLARQLDVIGQMYRNQIANYLAQLGEPKLYWIRFTGREFLEKDGEECDLVLGLTAPLLEHDDPVENVVYIGGFPAKVRSIYLEGILLSRAIINRVEPTPRRRIMSLLSGSREPYYLIREEIPVILITGSSKIAERQYAGIFNIPVYASAPNAMKELAEIRDKSVDYYIDLRAETEKVLHRYVHALREKLAEGLPMEVLISGMRAYTEEEVKAEKRSRIPLIILAAIAALLLTVIAIIQFGGV
ncbi:MAG: hypothetical protein QW692_02200 [Nitrososphaerota archaeon]